MTPVKLFTDYHDLPRESFFDGKFQRSAVRMDDALVVYNWLHPSLPKPPLHSHPFDQLVMIFEGIMELTVVDQPFVIRAGGILRVPAGVSHTARILGDDVCLNIDIFAPAREDYLYFIGNPEDEYSRPASSDGAKT